MKTNKDRIWHIVIWVCVLYFVVRLLAGCNITAQEQIKICTLPMNDMMEYDVNYSFDPYTTTAYTAFGPVCYFTDVAPPAILTVWFTSMDRTDILMIWIGQKNPFTGVYTCLTHRVVIQGEGVTQPILRHKTALLPGCR
jgi:hypothetical protein